MDPTGFPSLPEPLPEIGKNRITAVCKFIANANPKPNMENMPISRTFGKVAVLEKTWVQNMGPHVHLPQSFESWVVDVVQDQFPGENRGFLVLRPRYKLQSEEPLKLYVGGFDEILHRGTLYLRPKHAGPYWICPRALKEMLAKRHNAPASIIVTLAEPQDAAERAASTLKK